MNKITDLLSQLAAVDKDLAELDELEAKAGADLLLVATRDISIASARTKILDARLTIDLSNAKKEKAQPLRDKIASELHATLTKLAEQWNGCVNLLRERTETEIIAANLKFFRGDERAARRWWEAGRLIEQPIFELYRDGVYELNVLRRGPQWVEADMAKHFQRHIAKHSKVLGINPADFE